MMQGVLAVAAALAAYAGMSGLCLAMDKHYQKALAKKAAPAQKRALYWGGWAALAFSLALGIAAWGGVFGPVAWTGLLSLAVGVLALLLTYRVQWTPKLGAASLIVSVLLALAGAFVY